MGNATNAEIVTLDVVETLKKAGTEITATAAELNMAADSSANVEVVTTTNVITAAESGKTFFLNSATGFVSTLPAKAAGLRYTFYCGATPPTSGNHTIVCTNDDNTIFGQIVVAGLVIAADVEGSINMVASTVDQGDYVTLINDGTNWYVSGMATATGGITATT